MRVARRAVLGALGASAMVRGTPLGAAAGAAPPLIPVDVFAAKPAMSGLELSPDGKRVLARIQVRGKEMLGTYVLAGGELKAFALPGDSEVRWCRWAGNSRFIVSLSSVGRMRTPLRGNLGYVYAEGRGTRLFAYDLDTQEARFIGLKDGGMIGDDVLYLDPAGEELLLAVRKSFFAPPAVYRITLKDNRATWIERGLDGVSDWYADNAGVVRGAVGYDSKGWFFAYRSTPDQPIRPVANGAMTIFQRDAIGEMCFVAGSDDGYILADRGDGLNAVYKFNFATQQRGEQVFASPTNDIERLRFDETGHALEAIVYTDDRERTEWIDPLLKEIQAGLDKAMAGRINRIGSHSADKSVILVHSSTPRDPGAYYVYDMGGDKLSRLVRANEKLVPAQLSAMEAVRYPARDGLEIPAYLTLPHGHEPKGLPLVIMPHGGPYGVRDTLGFDTQVQFLANRGYAVLQPNYRGSESYGVEYFRHGQGEWGRKMQDDLDDGMDWLVKRGIVDPKRACLVGGSYGGYAAAWGATRNPERYRCAACFAGVFDLRSQLGYTSDFLYSRAYAQYRSTVKGAADFDLDSVSPLKAVDRLKVPVLLIHGDKDSVVPISQSKSYAAALARAGRPHEFHTIAGEGHGFGEDGTMAFLLGKYETFLKAHNPAG